MLLNNRVNLVRNYLSSHYMYVEDEWLAGCVEYLSENTDNNYNDSDIQKLAREQWLLNDLKDICPGSLPANLTSQQKSMLNGNYVLQINAAIDIGTPAYQQYLKLQKVNTENIDATIKNDGKIASHRMIKLLLTDGVQEISAIEYKPMRNLNCDITPGCKILIKGPVVCRRGVLLLTENVIELLGGEVQELAPSNSLAGQLSTKLGLPITQDSYLNTTIINHQRNTDIPTPHTEMPSATIGDCDNFESRFEENIRPVARVTSLQVASNFEDDLDMDQLDAIEAEFTAHPSKRSYSNNTLTNPEKRIKTDTTKSLNRPEDYPADNDFFPDEDEDYLKEIEAKLDEHEFSEIKKTGPTRVASEPFVYIKQINEMNESEKAGRVFKIKGQILKLLSKLSLGKDGWSLKCSLIDGTGCIDVEFTSNVLSKLVGYTPEEMIQLKKEIATNPGLKDKAVSALQKAKDTLQVLYCIIELTVLEVPKITNVIPFEEVHVNLLRERQTNCI